MRRQEPYRPLGGRQMCRWRALKREFGAASLARTIERDACYAICIFERFSLTRLLAGPEEVDPARARKSSAPEAAYASLRELSLSETALNLSQVGPSWKSKGAQGGIFASSQEQYAPVLRQVNHAAPVSISCPALLCAARRVIGLGLKR